MYILLLLLLIALIAISVLIFAIMPRFTSRPDYAPLKGSHYAHRGLHDNQSSAPENSMPAFQKAADAGYGIEMDVQLTKDRIPVVFHDETLSRVCGIDGNVRDYTYEELQQFPLYRSEERIPLFRDFLNLIDGRVPLIIEIKIHENANSVCQSVDALLKDYTGVYCIESFHPLAVKWYRDHRPEVIRGQLSSNFKKLHGKEPFSQLLVHHLLLNFLCRPDFIAYDHRHKGNLSRKICRSLFGALSVAWTIKSQEEMDACREDFDLFIFEGFMPPQPDRS